MSEKGGGGWQVCRKLHDPPTGKAEEELLKEELEKAKRQVLIGKEANVK